jgi:hypothetical protein
MLAVPLVVPHISTSDWSHRRPWVEKMGQNENHRLHEKKINNFTQHDGVLN